MALPLHEENYRGHTGKVSRDCAKDDDRRRGTHLTPSLAPVWGEGEDVLGVVPALLSTSLGAERLGWGEQSSSLPRGTGGG